MTERELSMTAAQLLDKLAAMQLQYADDLRDDEILSSDYAAKFNVTRQQAQRTLRSLADQGILTWRYVKVGGARCKAYREALSDKKDEGIMMSNGD